MAPTRRIDEIGSGMPFVEIYSTVLSKLFILPGMAEINIAEIETLEKKSKKDLILLFFTKNFHNLTYYKKNKYLISIWDFLDFFPRKLVLKNNSLKISL